MTMLGAVLTIIFGSIIGAILLTTLLQWYSKR